MIIRQYEVRCPRCQGGTVRVRDVPSIAYTNNYLSPEARKPVPEGDRWHYSVLEDCPACGGSRVAIGSVLERDGLPDGAEVDRS